MAATTTDSAEKDSPSQSFPNGPPLSGDAKEETTEQARIPEPGETEVLQMGELHGQQDEEEEGDVKPLVVPLVPETEVATGEDDDEDEMGCEIEESPLHHSPASGSDTGDCPEKEPKQEQMETSSDDSVKPSKDNDGTEKNCGGGGDTIMGRVGVEMSLLDGEPLSRVDSEDRSDAEPQIATKESKRCIWWIVNRNNVVYFAICKPFRGRDCTSNPPLHTHCGLPPPPPPWPLGLTYHPNPKSQLGVRALCLCERQHQRFSITNGHASTTCLRGRRRPRAVDRYYKLGTDR